MDPVLPLLALPILGLGLFGIWRGVRVQKRKRRRAELRSAPFSEAWAAILEKNGGLYARLPAVLKQELHGHIQVFIAEKNFEGCGGLELTDEIRVTVAAQACMLLLGRNPTYFPRLYSVLIYPSAYVAKRYGPMGGEGHGVNLGESWSTGTVVLAWDAARQGARDIKDGRNVTLHEFAHQLDQEDGAGDGAPILEQRSQYVAWGRVLGEEFDRFCKDQGKHVMDAYGKTNPAEFFAVLTETFFEKPRQLERKHPELYAQVQAYYQVDPAEWTAEQE